MNKKVLTAILLALLLGFTACGSDEPAGDGGGSTVGKVVYQNNDFQLLVPQEWEQLEAGDFTTAVPAGTVVAFRNNIKSDLFTANGGISKSELDKEMTSKDLALSTLSKAKVRVIAFTAGAESELEVNKGSEKVTGYLVHFSGRKSVSDPIVQFDQLFVVDGKTVFVLTGAYLQTEDESVVKLVGEMLNSFALK